MLSYNNGYTEAEALKALTGPNLKWRFPVRLLDVNNNFLRYLHTETVEKGSGDIDIDITRDSVWQYSAVLKEPYDYIIDAYSHRFMPEAWLRMPAPALAGDGDPFLKYPQGLYVAASFKRRRTKSKQWIIELGADDQSRILTYNTSAVFTALANTPVTTAIKNLLLAARIPAAYISIEPLPDTVKIAEPGREWEIGTPYIVILRDLAKFANLEWFFDERGIFIARKWVDYGVRQAAWRFVPDENSVVFTEYEEDEGQGLDTPNVVIGTVSRLQAGVSFQARAENTNQASKFSIPRRGFEITHKITLADAPDEPTFQEQVDRALAELSYAAKTGTLKTGLLPIFTPFSAITARTEDGAISLGEFEQDNNFDGWAVSGMTAPIVRDGALKAVSTADSFMSKMLAGTVGHEFDGSIYRFVKLAILVRGGGPDFIQVFFATQLDNTWSVNKSTKIKVIGDGDYHEYMVDMWNLTEAPESLWRTGRITGVRIDPVMEAGRRFEVAQVRIVKSEVGHIQEKVKYTLAYNATMIHTIRPIVATS